MRLHELVKWFREDLVYKAPELWPDRISWFFNTLERQYPNVRAGDRTDAVDVGKATVILFKPSGKYYTEEQWRVPDGAIGPWDMERSLDFRRIAGGAVLVATQEPWGFPYLFPGETRI